MKSKQLDLSFIFDGEKPAGRHGFLRAQAARLVFEDGTVARFWGTNFNNAACFPAPAYSEKVARRLAKFGVNLVRFHQMDADYSTPNIFQFTKGRRLTDTQSLDPISLDRLDYLIHCLKREGIYVYLDLLTYRTFRSGDGVAAADKIGHSARPYSTFDPRLIELQKKFNEQLWTHVNPYTKLAYKAEPAIVLTELTNENDVFVCSRGEWIEPYLGQLQARFTAWAGAKGIAIGQGPGNFTDNNPAIVDLLVDVQKSYYTEMTGHLRTLGVRIPISRRAQRRIRRLVRQRAGRVRRRATDRRSVATTDRHALRDRRAGARPLARRCAPRTGRSSTSCRETCSPASPAKTSDCASPHQNQPFRPPGSTVSWRGAGSLRAWKNTSSRVSGCASPVRPGPWPIASSTSTKSGWTWRCPPDQSARLQPGDALRLPCFPLSPRAAPKSVRTVLQFEILNGHVVRLARHCEESAVL